MVRTANVFARVEPEIKDQAEKILECLGIPKSNAVGMFLQQVVIQQGIPFEVKMPHEKPLAYGAMTKEEFTSEIKKALEDIHHGNVSSSDEVEAELKNNFDI